MIIDIMINSIVIITTMLVTIIWINIAIVFYSYCQWSPYSLLTKWAPASLERIIAFFSPPQPWKHNDHHSEKNDHHLHDLGQFHQNPLHSWNHFQKWVHCTIIAFTTVCHHHHHHSHWREAKKSNREEKEKSKILFSSFERRKRNRKFLSPVSRGKREI